MPIAMNWLTAKRLTAHGLLLGVTLWSLYIWTLATPGLRDRNGNLKGTDFLHFYSLGLLADAHRGADLYNLNAQAALAAQRVPDAAGIRYLPLYPPQVSLVFSVFARLPYAGALAAWWICCTAIYGICCYSVWRACPKLREYAGLVLLLAIAFPAFLNLIAWGQTSAIALACFTWMYFSLHDHRRFLAGIALGCLIFKPQLALAATIVFLVAGEWKILGGALVSGTAELFVGILYYGTAPFRQWIAQLARVTSVLPSLEPRPYQTHCLRTFWSMLAPQWPTASFAFYVLTALVVLGFTISVWRTATPLSLRYSALLLATVLISPHLTVYDLVILAPIFLLLADWLVARSFSPDIKGIGPLLYLVYALPLLAALTRWTHVQLSVIAMAFLLFLLFRLCMKGRYTPSPEIA